MNLQEKITTQELIHLQSALYYSQQSGLPFKTLIETVPTFKKALFRFIQNTMGVQKSQHLPIRILELGGGSGAVAQYFLQHALDLGVSMCYTIVDVNILPFKEIKAIFPNLTLINSTFDDFAANNQATYDFLIGNEALDMWAGQHYLEEFTDDSPQDISWTLTSQNGNKYWIKSPFVLADEANSLDLHEVIHLPSRLSELLATIEQGCLLQDYWTLNAELNNGLLVQLSQSTIKQIKHDWAAQMNHELYDYLDTISENLNDHSASWNILPIVPYGICDVTYRPLLPEMVIYARNGGFSHWNVSIFSFIESFFPNETEWKTETREWAQNESIMILKTDLIE